MQGCPERNKKTHPMHHTFMNSARKLRETLGYTQADVAEKIGVDVQKYSRMERSVNFLPDNPSSSKTRSSISARNHGSMFVSR